MRRRRTARPQRRPVFLGCEGESERGYGTLIGRLRDELRPDLHLDVTLLRPGGGDPLALTGRLKRPTIVGVIVTSMLAVRRYASSDTQLTNRTGGQE